MAISVDTVYKTVLLILNKEQRGYMTPDEFNKIATQVQLETFENYFESLNQQLRVPDNDSEYADRIKNIDEKIAIFKTVGNTTYIQTGSATALAITTAGTGYADSLTGIATTYAGSGTGLTVSVLVNASNNVTSVQIENPGSGYTAGDIVTISAGNNNATLTLTVSNSPAYFLPPSNLYRLGTVIYKDEIEAQLVQRNDLLYVNQSPLTKPTDQYPLYLYEDNKLYLKPATINSSISVSYVKKPADVIWNFEIPEGQNYYQYKVSGSQNFELDVSEQPEVIIKVLLYAGVVVKDYNLVNLAAQQVQAEQINQKS